MADPIPVSDLESHLGYWLRMVSNAVSQSFARRVEAEGVTVAEWVVLRVLHDAEDLAPSRLALRLGLTKGAISKLADRLMEKGLIVRHANDQDRRAHRLALTGAGRSLVPRLSALADDNDAGFFACLSVAERRALRTILIKLAGEKGLIAPPLE